MKKFIMWFEPHIRVWAIVYVIVCYLIFVAANLAYLKIDYIEDPYGVAMIPIALFWLGIIKIAMVAKSRLER